VSDARSSLPTPTRLAQPRLRDLAAHRSWHGQLSALWGFSRREYFIWQSYKSRQIMWVLDILTNATVFFIVGQLVGTNAASLLGPYGTNYITFILVGMMLYYFWLTNFRDPFSRIRRVYFGGTMDLYMLSPMHPHTPMLGLMGRSVFDDYPRAAVIMLFGTVLFGAEFRFDHLPLVVILTLITLVIGYGMGLISASMFYLFDFKQENEPFRFIVEQVLVAIVAGTYYPPTVLPLPFQWVAAVLPQTYANDALRRLLSPGADLTAPTLLAHWWTAWGAVTTDLVMLVGMLAIFFPIGWWLFPLGIEKARRNGTLTRWN
jgi:ABC-2 type transport system permease protein